MLIQHNFLIEWSAGGSSPRSEEIMKSHKETWKIGDKYRCHAIEGMPQ
jgi:hypothetical protein